MKLMYQFWIIIYEKDSICYISNGLNNFFILLFVIFVKTMINYKINHG